MACKKINRSESPPVHDRMRPMFLALLLVLAVNAAPSESDASRPWLDAQLPVTHHAAGCPESAQCDVCSDRTASGPAAGAHEPRREDRHDLGHSYQFRYSEPGTLDPSALLTSLPLPLLLSLAVVVLNDRCSAADAHPAALLLILLPRSSTGLGSELPSSCRPSNAPLQVRAEPVSQWTIPVSE